MESTSGKAFSSPKSYRLLPWNPPVAKLFPLPKVTDSCHGIHQWQSFFLSQKLQTPAMESTSGKAFSSPKSYRILPWNPPVAKLFPLPKVTESCHGIHQWQSFFLSQKLQ